MVCSRSDYSVVVMYEFLECLLGLTDVVKNSKWFIFIYSEHLGIPIGDPVLDDPVSDSFYKTVFLKRATLNTNIFQKVRKIFVVQCKQKFM